MRISNALEEIVLYRTIFGIGTARGFGAVNWNGLVFVGSAMIRGAARPSRASVRSSRIPRRSGRYLQIDLCISLQEDLALRTFE